MQRSLVFALVLTLAAVLGAVWYFSRGDTAPPPVPLDGPEPVVEAAAADTTETTRTLEATGTEAAHREMVAKKADAVLDDPEIGAALTGFKGRVVDHEKKPVAACGVRLYRGSMESILPERVDLFAEEVEYEPQYVAGETRTSSDGTFLIGGVWPRGLYLLNAGIGTDAPVHQLVTRTPSPGETVDLGDIVLPHAGVIVGAVVDEDGNPLRGALVRAADLPGTLAGFFPVERFDPEGAVLIREPHAPTRVLEMPKWVKPAFDKLPIPSGLTDGEGRFRLVGVAPGSNLLATTLRGYLSDMKPSVVVRAGQEKDVGTIKMKRGEELAGKVLDSVGKPVAGAEILAGSTLAMAPVDLAQRLGTSDAEGRFQGQGFAPGKVTVAARRGPGHPWVLAEPQQILGDVVVTLPATFAVGVSVTLADGAPAKEPRFRLLTGRAGDGAAEMNLMGFAPAVDLKERQKPVGEGQWRLENLDPGPYTLLAEAPGHSVAFAAFEISGADTSVAMQLTAPKVFTVRVLGPEDQPIRNAAIVAESRGTRAVEMPMRVGRTGADGSLVIDKLVGETLRVSGEHPRWGVAHGEVKPGEELVLRMQPPGALHGQLFENGKPAELGKFTVAIMRQRGGDARGPLEAVPSFVSPDAEGAFAVRALQPGSYELTPIKALDALRTPGGVFSFAQEAMFARHSSDEQVQIVSGQTAEVRLEAGEKPIEGPTATLSGSVTLDGRLGTGCVVSGWCNERRFTAKVDERGRFDAGTIPAGRAWISVMAPTADGIFVGPGDNLWSSNIEIAAGEAKELSISVETSSIAGVCSLPDGSPAAGVHVRAEGKPRGSKNDNASVWLHTTTDAQGAFKFAHVTAGTWALHCNARGNDRARGRLDGIEVSGGVPADNLRLQLTKSIVVKGRIDMAALGQKGFEWAWVAFHRVAENASPEDEGSYAEGVGIRGDTGEFDCDELGPGLYRVRLHVQLKSPDGSEARTSTEYRCEDLQVPPNGVEGVVLHPTVPAARR